MVITWAITNWWVRTGLRHGLAFLAWVRLWDFRGKQRVEGRYLIWYTNWRFTNEITTGYIQGGESEVMTGEAGKPRTVQQQNYRWVSILQRWNRGQVGPGIKKSKHKWWGTRDVRRTDTYECQKGARTKEYLNIVSTEVRWLHKKKEVASVLALLARMLGLFGEGCVCLHPSMCK